MRLEADYSAQAREIAVQLAVHFERAGDTVQAVHYWQQTGENAARRNAHDQRFATFTRALDLLATEYRKIKRQRASTLRSPVGSHGPRCNQGR